MLILPSTQLVTQLLITNKPLTGPENLRQTQEKQMPKEQRKISIRAGKNFYQSNTGRVAAVAARILQC